jgi:hypothetical protein
MRCVSRKISIYRTYTKLHKVNLLDCGLEDHVIFIMHVITFVLHLIIHTKIRCINALMGKMIHYYKLLSENLERGYQSEDLGVEKMTILKRS